LSFTGPPLGQPWNPDQVQFSVGEQVSITSNSSTSLAMSYNIGGVQGTPNLVPFNP